LCRVHIIIITSIIIGKGHTFSLLGELPYKINSLEEGVEFFEDKRETVNIPEELSAGMQEFLKGALKIDPKRRSSSRAMRSNSWIQG
jgi:hypothetical protein